MRPPTVTFGPFAFDPQSRVLRRGEEELPLPPRVLGVLEVLLNRAGDVVTRQELMASVWKDAFVTDTSLAEAISLLRQALGDDAQAPVYIQTLHRRGYRFVAPVAARLAEAAVPAGGTAAGLVNRHDADALARGQNVSSIVRPSIGRQLVPWSVAAISAAIAIAACWQAIRRDKSSEIAPLRFSIALEPGTRLDTSAPALALSPDGATAVWSACDAAGCRLYVRPADRLEPGAIAGTQGAAAPFFSPEGRSVAFFADGRLKKVSLAGGAPVTLADAADPLGGAWTPRGRIIYAGATHGLLQISENGGEPEVLTVPRETLGEVRHTWPSLSSSDGDLYFTIATTPDLSTGGRVGVLRLDDAMRSWQTLFAGAGMTRAVGKDALVFSRTGELQGIGFDRLRLTTTGTPITILDGVARASGGVHFAVSAAGTLFYAPAPASTGADPCVWWTAGGPSTPLGQVRDLIAPALSPDGARLAGSDAADGSRGDIWIADLRRGSTTRLTHGGLNTSPVWSADGSIIYYASRGQGAFELWQRDAEALRSARRLHGSEHHTFPTSATTDGALLAFVRQAPASRSDIWILPTGGGAPQPLIQGPFDEIAAAFSPDGSLVAYQSNEGGRWDIFLHRRSDGRKIPVSPEGGTGPFWSRDGRILYYSSGGRLMRVPIAADAVTRAGPPELVGDVNGATIVGVDPDGRFLLQRRVFGAADRAIVTVNWVRELRQLLGPPAALLPR